MVVKGRRGVVWWAEGKDGGGDGAEKDSMGGGGALYKRQKVKKYKNAH